MGKSRRRRTELEKKAMKKKKKDRKVEPRVSYKGTKFLKMRRSYKSGKTMRSEIDKFEREKEREREEFKKNDIYVGMEIGNF